LAANVAVLGTVATAVLLEESVIGTPLDPVGTNPERVRVRLPCWALPTIVSVGLLQETVAPTWIVNGVGAL